MSLSIDKNLIAKKLLLIEEHIAELTPIVALDETAIRKDSLRYHTAERMFQLLVDEMIDINTHIIRTHLLPPPDDLQSTFQALGDADILPKEFVQKISPIVGLRNAIVHRYEHVDLDRFIHELKRNFSDFKTYHILISEKFLK